jgi:molybdenum cofactor biosynthesis protein B
MPSHVQDLDFLPLNVAILTVSDSRSAENDTSGDLLAERATTAGHQVVARELCRDDRYLLRAVFSHWIAAAEVQVILSTGGTGITGRDNTPEAMAPLLDKRLDGFGELFRALSFQEIGAATIQSRALAGLANATLLFCLPGSTGACRTAWDGILGSQLDRRTRPCNFVQLIARFDED